MRIKTIDLKNVSIGYNLRNEVAVIAQQLNTTLYQGELTCLLGGNGVGKSTLLKTLSGFLKKIEGEIIIDGKDIEKISEKELAKLVSIVLTDKVSVLNLKVKELIALGRTPYNGFWGKINQEDQKIVQDSIQMVNIENLSERNIDTLSDGERQKVMIAKALAQDTPIILLDEPTAFLDFPSKVEIIQLLYRLTRETSKTILMSTHDLELALQSADKLWLMEKNSKMNVGTSEDLALQGILNGFFKNKGIYFDESTGLFRIKNPTTHQINVKGKGIRYSMMKKALMRNRIEAVDNTQHLDQIVIHDSHFEIHFLSGKSIIVNTIEEVLEQIL